MHDELTPELLDQRLREYGMRRRIANIDLGVYHPLKTPDGRNAFAIAYANPGQSVPAVIDSPQPIAAKVLYVPSTNRSTRPASQTTDFWNESESPLSSLSAASAQDDDDPRDLGDENENLQETDPSKTPGDFTLTIDDQDQEVLSFKISSPYSDQPTFASLLPTGNVDPYDASNHEKLIDQDSSVEAKIRKSGSSKTGRTKEKTTQRTENSDDEPDSDIIGSRRVPYSCGSDYEFDYDVLDDFFARNFDQLVNRLGRGLEYETRQDMVQEAFVSILRNRNAIQTLREPIATYKRGNSDWLFNLFLQKASYLAIDLMRKKEMKLRRHSIDAPINGQDDEASLASNLESNEPTPLENLLNKEEVMLFEQALAQLQEDYRAAITIFYFVGLSIQECADFFGMNSSEAFKSRKSRAVKNLRDIINTLSQRQKIGADC